MSIIEDQQTKERLQRSADEYKEKLENDVYQILKDVEKILAGAAIGGTIALTLYLLLNRGNSKEEPVENDENELKDYDDSADPGVEKASFVGSLGQVFFNKGKELLAMWLLTEAKKRLNEYLDNLSKIEEDVNNEVPQ